MGLPSILPSRLGQGYPWRPIVYEGEDGFAEYTAESASNPRGDVGGSSRVRRGGCWAGGAEDCRAAYRYWYAPSRRYGRLGFRLARTVSLHRAR
jgi:formylglycine-generating enzyme required for sulfatase activity